LGRYLIARVRWADMSLADKRRLHRALLPLSSDIALAQVITGGEATAKAAAP
jgi:hypothetical protein